MKKHFFIFISEMQPKFGVANVTINRAKYKMKKYFFIFISEMQPKFGAANVTIKRGQHKIERKIM